MYIFLPFLSPHPVTIFFIQTKGFGKGKENTSNQRSDVWRKHADYCLGKPQAHGLPTVDETQTTATGRTAAAGKSQRAANKQARQATAAQKPRAAPNLASAPAAASVSSQPP